jgi:hypothetical protein
MWIAAGMLPGCPSPPRGRHQVAMVNFVLYDGGVSARDYDRQWLEFYA